MSGRPSEQGPSNDGNYGTSDGQGRSRPSSAMDTQPISDIRTVLSPPTQRLSEIPERTFELPPLPKTSSTARVPYSPSAPRISNVSSILNPPQPEELDSNRRRKASQLESPASSVQSLPPILSSSQAPSAPSTFAAPSPSAQYIAPTERPQRRILTPRSPSGLHRAASLGQLNPSAGTISAQRTPFPTSPRGRPYTVEPGAAGAPPLPTPPGAGRPGYGFPAPTPPSEAARRASTGTSRVRAHSPSASPSTSYSSYSQAGHTSPPSHYAQIPLTTLSAAYNASSEAPIGDSGAASGPTTTVGSEHQRQMGIPISSSGSQSVYQMLTLETTAGTVQLPVDVQAASRQSDEKRKRNAGASARFRQRRKEKEKEATTSIARLEQQVKELNEDIEFYRSDRESLATIVLQIPGGERHFPRPPSPRRRRVSAAQLPGPSGAEGAGYVLAREQGPRSPDDGRHVRRRTSTYSLPAAQLQPSLPGPGAAIQPSYGSLASQLPPSMQSPSGPMQSPLLRGSLPPPSQMPSGQAQHYTPGPPSVLQSLPQTGPPNPYAPERRPSGPPGTQREGR